MTHTLTRRPFKEKLILNGTYSYETFSPTMTGTCSDIYEVIGCYDDLSCQIMGSSGEMTVMQTGNSISIGLSTLAPNRKFTGVTNGISFSTNLYNSQSQSGCTAIVSSSITGNITNASDFSGVVKANLRLSGSCNGYSLNCNLAANYNASK